MRRISEVVRDASAWLPVAALLGSVAIGTPGVSAAGTSLVLSPSTTSVNPGESFRVDVVLSTTTPTRGVQFGLTYDPKLVQIDQVEPGSFYSSWSDAHDGLGAAVLPFQPHNDTGRLSPGAIVVLRGPVDGPSGSGTVMSLRMTAKPGALGRSPLLLTDVVVSSVQAESIPDVTWTGSIVGVGLGAEAVGSPPEPVLAASDTPVQPRSASQPGFLAQIMGVPPINFLVAGLLAGCVGTVVGLWLLGWRRPAPAPARPAATEFALER